MKRRKKAQVAEGPSREDKALEQFAELMISKLESITRDWKKPWFTEGVLGWPQNFSGRQYNGMNALMLTMVSEKNGYDIPVWCTFDRVEGLNGHKNSEGKWCPEVDENGEKLPRVGVKKGEKSFPVFITVKSVVNAETKERINYEEYRQMNEEDREKWNVYPKLQVYNVFNISQTNIDEARPQLFEKIKKRALGEKPEHDLSEMWSFPAMDKMIEEGLWLCPIKPTMGDDAYYSISKDVIVVPLKEQFKDGQSFYANTWHEMAHSTGAESRLGRLKPASFGSKAYAREELIAELSAALVGLQYGLMKNIKEDSIPYLKNWLDTLKEEPSFIKTVLLDVRKASSLIIKKIDEIGSQGENLDSDCGEED